MHDLLSKPCTAFDGHRLLLSGPLIEVALAVKNASKNGVLRSILVFDDRTGRVIDLDLRGTKADIIERLLSPSGSGQSKARRMFVHNTSDETESEPGARGRPKLGVVGREVTLLPRHWDWLAAQPGSASVALRKLVEEACRTGGTKQKIRVAQDAAYHFMSALAGDMPGFEEATRALFANDRARFKKHIAEWPEDVRVYATRLAFGWQHDGSQFVLRGEDAPAITEQPRYLEPTQATARALNLRAIEEEVVMLNLLRFRAVADYSNNPEMAPDKPISGAEAYDRYIAHTLPYLRESGGDLLFLGEGGQFLIGPEHERWDRAMLVLQHSTRSFMAFATNKAYITGLAHRTAALEDSRLLPLVRLPLPS
jgi:uncharacterized protein